MTHRLPTVTRVASAAAFLLASVSLSACSFIRDFDDFESGSCVAPMADCTAGAGCETLTSTDRLHCGGCGIACGATEFCLGSTCRNFVGELGVTATGMTGIAGPLVAPGRNDGMFLAFNHGTPLTVGSSAVVPATNPELLVTRINASGAANWAVGMNGPGTEVARAVARRTSPEGIVVVGSFSSATATYASVTPSVHGPVNLGAANTLDGFVWALDETGNYAWDLRFGGAGETSVDAVVTDGSGNTYVAGFFTNTDLRIGTALLGTNVASGSTFSSGLFVTKILVNGAPMWTRLIDAPHTALESLAVDPQGNVYVFGTSSGTINIGANPPSVGNSTPRLIALSAATGAVSWFQAYDSAAPSAVGGAGVIVMPGGDVYIAFHADNASGLANVGIARGTVLAQINPATGDALASGLHELGDDFLLGALAVDSTGQIIVGATVNTSAATTIDVGGGAIPHDPMSGRDIGIFGYGPDGTYQWAVTYGASGDDSISSVALSAEGSVFVGGPFTQDFSVAGVAFTFTGSGPNAYAARIGPEAQ